MTALWVEKLNELAAIVDREIGRQMSIKHCQKQIHTPLVVPAAPRRHMPFSWNVLARQTPDASAADD